MTSGTRSPYQIPVTTMYPMPEKDDTSKTGYKSNISLGSAYKSAEGTVADALKKWSAPDNE